MTTAFTPIASLAGGAMIGLSAVLLMADSVAKVESCNGLNFWRELEARRDR
jgi:hypothetical protein